MNTQCFFVVVVFGWFFLGGGGEMAKDKRGMGKAGKQDYLGIDRAVYLLLAKINPGIYSL